MNTITEETIGITIDQANLIARHMQLCNDPACEPITKAWMTANFARLKQELIEKEMYEYLRDLKRLEDDNDFQITFKIA